MEKWNNILYYERNRSPKHKDFIEFEQKVSDPFYNPLGAVGYTAAIQYFMWLMHKKIAKVHFLNHAINIDL